MLEIEGLMIEERDCDIYFDLAYNDASGSRELLCDQSLPIDENLLKKFVDLYKIHLMPNDNDFIPTVIALTNAIENNPVLQHTISGLKIKPIFETDIDTSYRRSRKIFQKQATGNSKNNYLYWER